METENYLQLALNHHYRMSIFRFIEVVKYPINVDYLAKYWYSLVEGHPYYIDDLAIIKLGFTDLTKAERWNSFKKVMGRYRMGIDFHHLSDDIYRKFLNSQHIYRVKYPPIDKSLDGNGYHLLVEASCLASLMSIDAKVEQHYNNIMNLSRLFGKYESIHDAAEMNDFVDLGTISDGEDNESTINHRNAIELARTCLGRIA